jgi:hypothetical protein
MEVRQSRSVAIHSVSVKIAMNIEEIAPNPFGGYLGKHRNPLKDDAIFGGAFIIGGVVFFVLLAFGIRELATGRDDERKLIDDNEAPKKCAEYERDSTESKSSTKPR